MGFHSYVLLLPSNKVKNYDLLISVDLSTAGSRVKRARFPMGRKAPNPKANQWEGNLLKVQGF